MTDDESLIREEISAAGVTSVGRISSSDTERPVYFATVVVERDSDGKQKPSNRTLKAVRDALLAKGVLLEFLLRYENSEEVEAGLRATLLHSHIDQIRNAFFSFDAGRAHLWIEPKQALEQTAINAMIERAEAYLQLFDIRLGSTSITSDEVLPTKLSMLIAIRQLAPVTLTALAMELKSRGYEVPSSDWLLRKLDLIRKEGGLVRLASGEFALTRQSLHALGTAKNRQSPDISRLLALARRGS